MTTAGRGRRRTATVRWAGNPEAVAWAGTKALPHAWPVLSAYFRDALMAPRRLDDDDGVEWVWTEVPDRAEASATECAALRRRLSAGVELLSEWAEAEAGRTDSRAKKGGGDRIEIVGAMAAWVRAWNEKSDTEAKRWIARTEHGWRLHSWGAQAAAEIVATGDGKTAQSGATDGSNHDEAGKAPAENGAAVAGTSAAARGRKRTMAWVAAGGIGALAALGWIRWKAHPTVETARVAATASAGAAGAGESAAARRADRGNAATDGSRNGPRSREVAAETDFGVGRAASPVVRAAAADGGSGSEAVGAAWIRDKGRESNLLPPTIETAATGVAGVPSAGAGAAAGIGAGAGRGGVAAAGDAGTVSAGGVAQSPGAKGAAALAEAAASRSSPASNPSVGGIDVSGTRDRASRPESEPLPDSRARPAASIGVEALPDPEARKEEAARAVAKGGEAATVALLPEPAVAERPLNSPALADVAVRALAEADIPAMVAEKPRAEVGAESPRGREAERTLAPRGDRSGQLPVAVPAAIGVRRAETAPITSERWVRPIASEVRLIVDTIVPTVPRLAGEREDAGTVRAQVLAMRTAQRPAGLQEVALRQGIVWSAVGATKIPWTVRTADAAFVVVADGVRAEAAWQAWPSPGAQWATEAGALVVRGTAEADGQLWWRATGEVRAWRWVEIALGADADRAAQAWRWQHLSGADLPAGWRAEIGPDGRARVEWPLADEPGPVALAEQTSGWAVVLRPDEARHARR